MKPYPAYKDSGLAWLGPIPEHWETRRLKQVCQLAYGDSLANEARRTGSVPVYGSNGIVGYHDTAITDAPCLIIGRKGSFGKVNLADEPCFPIDTTFYINRRLTKQNVRWLGYVIRTLNLDAISNDTAVPGLSREDAYQRVLVLPPFAEQAAIVSYLDLKTAGIEGFITKKRQLIALLNEQKAAIINRAVTKGLNPDVAMKASGVEWLGEVPAHWQVRRNGASFGQRVEPGDKELPVLVVSLHSGVTVGEEDKDDPKRLIEDRAQYKRTCKGDIAYNMMRMWQGAVGVVPVDGLVSPAYVVARPLPGTDSRFFNYLFRTDLYKNEVNRQSRGIVPDRNRLYWADFKQMLSPHPPPDEQQQIVQEIERRCQHIEVAITRIEREIELIKEYRTTLISEAVTGKIDVQEAAGSLTT